MGKISLPLAAVILGVVTLAIFYLALPRIDRYLTIQAVSTCAASSKFVQENSAESFTAEYPLKDLYESCLTKTK